MVGRCVHWDIRSFAVLSEGNAAARGYFDCVTESKVNSAGFLHTATQSATLARESISMKPDLQQLESQNTPEEKNMCKAASDESSREMANERCPNDAASVSDDDGLLRSDHETEQQQRF
jgi:hypothetical protein